MYWGICVRARWYNYKQLLLIFVRRCENAHASTNPHTHESMRQFPPARGGRPSGMCVHRQHGSVCVCLCSTRHTVRFACGARVRACVCAYNTCWCACEILRPHPKTILLANYRGTKTHLLHGNLVQLCAFAISCADEGVCENWARNKLRAVFYVWEEIARIRACPPGGPRRNNCCQQ